MSPSEKKEEYVHGWANLMKLVRNGHSWSGVETNRFFRNEGGVFHEMSHLAGLDHNGDGRGLAVVDWDQDGKLDLWYRNRTAPRLRLMMNRRECGDSVSIKLEGTNSNRDGIGAVVELLPVAKEGRLVRSVRAGDLYLSQSSKWLHFGTGKESVFTHAMVTWPGGEKEKFEGLKISGRFHLKQGRGKAIAVTPRKQISIKAEKLKANSQDSGRARIILPSRIPMPSVVYRKSNAKQGSLVVDGKPRLMVLWSGTCGHCKNTLEDLSKKAGALRSAQLEVLALAVDGAAGPAADVSAAYDLIDSSSFPFQWGLIDNHSIERVHQLQEKLFDRTPASTVPLAILLDKSNRSVAIYRGGFGMKEVLDDWKKLSHANEATLHHLAPPLKGTWFTNPLPQQEVIRVFNLR